MGAFWQPKLVVCDPEMLGTLDSRNISCGMAEVIEHACIRSRKLYESLLICSDIKENISDIIIASLLIKRDIIERDELERGERMLLNFGHTLGHALEKLHSFRGITHGEAVAIGMSVIARAGEYNGLTKKGTADSLSVVLKSSAFLHHLKKLPAGLPYARSLKPRAVIKNVQGMRLILFC